MRRTGKGVFWAAALLLSVLVMFQSSGGGQQDDRAKQRLAKGMSHYDQAQFDKAIEILSDLAKDPTLDKRDQQEVLLCLGRAYVAKGSKDKALWAISKMLDLEPPMIEPDPNAECPPLMRVYYEARKQKSGSSMVQYLDPGIKTIAILDFKNRSIDDKEKYDPLEKGFADLLINHLNGATNLKVIERERIQWILDEIGLENDPEKFDMGSAVRVGKQLGVHTVLLGSFIKVKDELKLLARLVKVETSEILMTEDATGEADDFFDLAQNLSVKVAKDINVKLAQAEAESGTETKSLDAMLSYSEGLVFIEKGEYKEAFDKFMQALAHDPTYEKARQKADSIKPLAG